MKLQTLTMMKGLPASGKSTYALEKVRASEGRIKRVNKDDIRAMIDGGKWSREREKVVLQTRDELVELYLSLGFDVIVDDTNFEPKHEERLRYIGQSILPKFIFEVKEVDTPVEVCVERDAQRENPVGEAVIRGMWDKYLKPTIEPVPEAPDALICDLDGTLALLNGRNPYDASECGKDQPNQTVVDLVRTYAAMGVRVLLVSGREKKYEDETRAWLSEHRILFAELFMREAGDKRKDAIIKQEIYDTHIKGKYNVRFVLDDRNQVVEMWRRNGLTCLQVAFGNF